MKSRDLKQLLKKKNPYLFKAKNLNFPLDLVSSILDASLSSSEEEIFGRFLEDLAIFIVQKTANGRKSTTTGIDLEFETENILYLVSVKSGPNWGNNSQQAKQRENFEKAVRTAKQSHHTGEVVAVLGICYGKTKTNMQIRGAMKVVGQNFWYMISGDTSLYKEIIEPLGEDARKHNEAFHEERERIVGRFTAEFSREFSREGLVDWQKLVEFTSGNLDMEQRDGRFVQRQ